MNEIDFVQNILSHIVSKPEAIKINEVIDDRGVLLNVNVDSSDYGQVCGKMGANLSAIRLVAKLMGHKVKKRISIKLLN